MNTRKQKLIAIVLATLMVLYAFPLYGIAEDTVASESIPIDSPEILEETPFEEAALAEEDAEPMILYEDKKLRTEDTKHYRMTDGSFTAVKFDDDVHYEKDGEWEEIDNSLVLDPSSTKYKPVYRNFAGNVLFRFEGDPTDGKVSAEYEDYEISFELIDLPAPDVGLQPIPKPGSQVEVMSNGNLNIEANESSITAINDISENTCEVAVRSFEIEIINPGKEKAEVMTFAEMTEESNVVTKQEKFTTFTLDQAFETVKSSSVINFTDSTDDFTLSYNLTGNTLKENIIVNNKSSEYTYKFALNTVGLVPALTEDGSVSLNNVDGESIFTIPAPYMFDAGNEYSDNVSYTVSGTAADGYVLTVTADPEWINAADRALPVVIDPALTLTNDTNEESITTEYTFGEGLYTTYGTFPLGYFPSEDLTYTGFVKINELPILPDNCVPVDARICLAQQSFDCNSITSFIVSAHTAVCDIWDIDVTTDALDYTTLKSGSNGKYVEWEITPAVKEWYADPESNYGIVLQPIEDMSSFSYGNAMLVTFGNSGYHASKQPKFIVQYRNTVGTESYYSYTTQNVNRAGTAYVRDYNGNLTLIKSDLSNTGTAMSFVLNHIYNSNYADELFTNINPDMNTCNYSQMSVGRGWKLNIQQTIVPKTLEAVDGSVTTYLVYTDGDGTEHYFYRYISDETESNTENLEVYVDEDGLLLTIEKDESFYYLTDTQDNTLTFLNGYLYKIEDANGNYITIIYGADSNDTLPLSTNNRITAVVQSIKQDTLEENNDEYLSKTIAIFTYDSLNRISTVKDEVNNLTTYYYDANDRIVKIKHPDGTYAKYSYNDLGYMTQAYDAEIGYGIDYTYGNSGQVTSFEEFSATYNSTEDSISDKITGAKYCITNIPNEKTYIRYTGADRIENTADDIVTTYLFDDYGRTVNTYSSNSIPGDTYAPFRMYGTSVSEYTVTEETPAKTDNKITAQAATGSLALNFLQNSSFDVVSNVVSWQKEQSNGTAYHLDNMGRTGSKAYVLDNYNGNANCNIHVKQSVSLTPGTYTFSGYIKTIGFSNNSDNAGAMLRVVSGNTEIARSRVITASTKEEIADGWERLSVTFDVNSTGTYTCYFSMIDSKGVMICDDALLEENDGASRINVLDNGNIEGTNGSTWYASGSNGYSTVKAHGGSRSLALTSNITESAEVYNTVSIYSDGGVESFVLGGWAWANAVPYKDDDSVQFKLYAKLIYSTGDPEYKEVDFNPDIRGEWQYASCPIVSDPDRVLTQVRVYCKYAGNNGTAYFDDIALVREAVQTYTYDENGNLTNSSYSETEGETTYEYDGSDVTGVSAPGQSDTEAEYDLNHLLTQLLSDDQISNFDYDAAGNVISETISSNYSSEVFSAFAEYQNNDYLTSVTDGIGNTVTYNYNNKRQISAITSPISNTGVEDDTTVTTNYLYDLAGRASRAYIDQTAELSNYYTNGLLSGITRKGYVNGQSNAVEQNYSFTYDSFGNTLSVSIGETVLVSYEYAPHNGNLIKITYGNGFEVSYNYDYLDRVTSISYNNVERYRHFYNGDGALVKSIDLLNNTTTYYDYDGSGRLNSYQVYDVNDEFIEGEYYTYDTLGRPSDYISVAGANETTTVFTYNEDSNIDTMDVGDSIIRFGYDPFNRLISKSIEPDDTDETNLHVRYRYKTYDNNEGSAYVSDMQYAVGNLETDSMDDTVYLRRFQYEYDNLGNIKRTVTGQSSNEVRYYYDSQNQLVLEVNSVIGKSYYYTYDTYGNIRTKNTYAAVFSDYEDFMDAVGYLGKQTETYSYTDSNSRDKLTVYNGHALVYDGIGNPTTYYNNSGELDLTWSDGRLLTFVSADAYEATYIYNSDGLRTSKEVDEYVGEYINRKYYYSGNKLVSEEWGDKNLEFLYDDSGIYGINYNDGTTVTKYYFIKNLQGDVVEIINQNHSLVAKYAYDAWGNLIWVRNAANADITDTDHIALINPIRYRGYYYDRETGFYYLNSRYYDPSVARFINTDVYLSTGQGFIGFNMYTYCNNNPVNHFDITGQNTVNIIDFVLSRGGDVGYVGDGQMTKVLLNHRLFVFYSDGSNKHNIPISFKNGEAYADEVYLACIFEIPQWTSLMKGFEEKEGDGFSVDYSGFFLSKGFCLRFAKDVIKNYAPDTSCGMKKLEIAMELFGHAYANVMTNIAQAAFFPLKYIPKINRIIDRTERIDVVGDDEFEKYYPFFWKYAGV